MHSKDFIGILDEQIFICKSTLSGKAKEYATDDDRLHNFKLAAALQGCSQIEALAGMMVKHTVSIYDMCTSDQLYSKDLWSEKITDHINYLILLKAVLYEESLENLTEFLKTDQIPTENQKEEIECQQRPQRNSQAYQR